MCVLAHVYGFQCLCIHQTDCRTIFSVNSLGQALPLGRERAAKCMRVSDQVTQSKGTQHQL